jgi:hypothetical protein
VTGASGFAGNALLNKLIEIFLSLFPFINKCGRIFPLFKKNE